MNGHNNGAARKTFVESGYGGSGGFYGAMADQVLTQPKYTSHRQNSRDLDRRVATGGNKRAYGEVTRESVYSNQTSRYQPSPQLNQVMNKWHSSRENTFRKKKIRRNDQESKKKRRDGTDSQAEDSGMEDDAGGSSQDKLESDFIDDGREEEIEQSKARRLKKGQIDESEEEEYCDDQEEVQKEESDDDPDPYEFLELADGQPEDGWKYNPDSKDYLLEDFFCIPASIYENLFEH